MSDDTRKPPQIYVVCVAADEEGLGHGEWIDATLGVEHVREEIDVMLDLSPARTSDGWAITDQRDFGEIELAEDEEIANVVAAAKLVQHYGEVAARLIELYRGVRHVEAAQAIFDGGAYLGAWDDEREWARELVAELGELEGLSDQEIADYDYDGFAEALLINGYFTIEVADKVHIFTS